MRAIPARWLARVFAGVSLAISLNAPAPARAGCEHPADRPAIGLDVSRPGGVSHDPRQGDPAPPPRPCSGPRCSDRSAPPPAPATQVPPRSEFSLLLVEPAAVRRPGSPSGMPADVPEWPLPLATSIFHPPRPRR